MADPHQIGMLTQAVNTLTNEVSLLRAKVEEMEAKMNRGQGFAIGMLLASGGIGAAIATTLGKLFGK